MKKLYALVLTLSLIFVAACGTTSGFAPKSGRSGFDNARTIDIRPHGNRPPSAWLGAATSLGAQWNEAHKDSVILIVQVNSIYTGITGAELNIDGERVVLNSMETATEMDSVSGIKSSSNGFGTDLEVVRKILTSKRTWLRVQTPTGTIESAIIDDGKDSMAYNALKRFITEVDKK